MTFRDNLHYALAGVAVLALLLAVVLLFVLPGYDQAGAVAVAVAGGATEAARRSRAARRAEIEDLLTTEDPAELEHDLEEQLAEVAQAVDEVPLDELVARDPGARLL